MARVIRYVLEKTAGIMVIHKYMHHCKLLYAAMYFCSETVVTM